MQCYLLKLFAILVYNIHNSTNWTMQARQSINQGSVIFDKWVRRIHRWLYNIKRFWILGDLSQRDKFCLGSRILQSFRQRKSGILHLVRVPTRYSITDCLIGRYSRNVVLNFNHYYTIRRGTFVVLRIEERFLPRCSISYIWADITLELDGNKIHFITSGLIIWKIFL